MPPPLTLKQAIGVSPAQTILMALNIAIVVLVCLFGAWGLYHSTAAPITTLTLKDVQALKTAFVVQHEDHEVLQQLMILTSQQSAQIGQLIPALRETVEAINSLATQNVRIRTEVQRAAPPKNGKK